MNGACHIDEKQLDILPHKYRPECVDRLICHSDQALRLKQWIQEFMSASSDRLRAQDQSEYDDSSCDSESGFIKVAKNCVLLTGPPGVGKTSLVYTIAKELKLHVVESHPSEKRDSKLFSMLKLTNQKGKINAIAKLFQAARQQQQQAVNTRRKRRKLSASTENNQPQKLSLSGATSIVLFDDIDVVFEEDGPFLKSLVEFVKESKRPVVLTATQSIDHIKKVLIECEHIHLYRPIVEDCAKILRDICKREKYHRLSRSSRCTTIASHLECDIRQCLNQIHFYGDHADEILQSESEGHDIRPDFTKLNFQHDDPQTEDNKAILSLFTNRSLIDLMDSRFNFTDRSTLMERWLNGQPSVRNEEHGFNHNLGEQIRKSIVELTRGLHSNQMTREQMQKQAVDSQISRGGYLDMARIINMKINSRVEPPDKEFYTDIVPHFSEVVKSEAFHRLSCQTAGTYLSSRRTRRVQSYLESIPIYLETDDCETITATMLNPDRLFLSE